MIDGRAEGFTVVGLKEGGAEISSVVYEVRRLSHKSISLFTYHSKTGLPINNK